MMTPSISFRIKEYPDRPRKGQCFNPTNAPSCQNHRFAPSFTNFSCSKVFFECLQTDTGL